MNQKRNFQPASPFVRTLLLTGGFGCFSLSLFSAGIAFAQTPPLDLSVPSAADLLQEDLSQPDLQPSSQAPIVDTSAEATSDAPIDAPIDATIDITVDAAPLSPDPVIAAPERVTPEVESFSSETSTPAPLSSTEPPIADEQPIPQSESAGALVSPNLANDASKAFGGGSYIDSTPYSLGATQKPDVILSERSTGCQAVVSADQTAPASICPPVPMAGAEGGSLGNYDPGSLTVYNLQPGAGVSARDFYNLTVRPPAQLSNGNVSLLFPLSIPAAITSAFGWRLHPVGGDMRFHSGTDLGAPQGTPVLAAFGGKVDIADLVGGYGLTVVLQHNKGTEQTLYAHLSEVFVKPGEEVKQGEVIGRVGSTGLSTGPHLHFEFRKLTPEGWVVMNPAAVLERSLAQFVEALKTGKANPTQQLPVVFRIPGKALIQGVKPQDLAKAKGSEQTQNPLQVSEQPSQPLFLETTD